MSKSFLCVLDLPSSLQRIWEQKKYFVDIVNISVSAKKMSVRENIFHILIYKKGNMHYFLIDKLYNPPGSYINLIKKRSKFLSKI